MLTSYVDPNEENAIILEKDFRINDFSVPFKTGVGFKIRLALFFIPVLILSAVLISLLTLFVLLPVLIVTLFLLSSRTRVSKGKGLWFNFKKRY
ncbi:MAG: hypothetical protein MRJ65_02190 [Candidatus Brocadiaceae bacterium]|nr:hypothetical protein [Candidatus Brocadiaceae bacterium]